MSVERRLWTSSALDLGQVIVAAAAVDPEFRVGIDQNAVVVSAQDGRPLLAVWPSVPAVVGPTPWVAEAFVLADTGVAEAVVENLETIGSIAEEMS